MAKAVKVGDVGTAHNGYPPTPVTSGSSTIKIDGIPAARVGDSLLCHSKPKNPPHPRTIVQGSTKVFFDGKPAAITGGAISCGGVTIGSGTVNIGTGAGSSSVSSTSSSSTQTTNNAVTTAKATSTATNVSNAATIQAAQSSQQNDDKDEVIINTKQQLPDQHIRSLLNENRIHVMFATTQEVFEYLQKNGWKQTETAWVEATSSDGGQIFINYGLNGKDVVTTAMILAQLKTFGIKASVQMGKRGEEVIKFTGYKTISKLINTHTYMLDNPKIVQLGIGKFGVKNNITSGAVLTIYVAGAYRILDFWLNDETSLTDTIGGFGVDLAKAAIGGLVTYGITMVASVVTGVVTVPLVVTVVISFGVAYALNTLDEQYKISDKVVAVIERAEQEVIEKALEVKERTEKSIIDAGAMFIDGLLETGKEVVVNEIEQYLKKTVNDLLFQAY
jgi:uncharacterized Zn-binding protein involved in type VI secretion